MQVCGGSAVYVSNDQPVKLASEDIWTGSSVYGYVYS